MKKQNKLAGLQRRKAISGYLFIMPFIVGFLAFMVKPFFESLYMSFCDIELGPGKFDKIFNVYEHTVAVQIDGCEPSCGCWELNASVHYSPPH